MEKSEKEKKLIDVRQYPIRPHVGVGTVIKIKDKVLLIKRKYNPDAGKWAIPDGHLDLGETPEEGAAQETEEEVGIKVKIQGLSGIINKVEKDPDGRIKYHYILINFFAVPIDEGNFTESSIRLSEESLDGKFVPICDLPHYDLTNSLKEHFIALGYMK